MIGLISVVSFINYSPYLVGLSTKLTLTFEFPFFTIEIGIFSLFYDFLRPDVTKSSRSQDHQICFFSSFIACFITSVVARSASKLW